MNFPESFKCIVCSNELEDYNSILCDNCHDIGIDVQETLYGPVIVREDHDCFISYEDLDEYYRREYRTMEINS